jgi:Uma2 family endonuclease
MSFAMSLATLPGAGPQELPPLPPYRFTVRQYHHLIRTGVLAENDRVELLEGWVIPKMTHNPPHDATVDLAQTALTAILRPGCRIRVQSAITTANSVPEPDVAVVRGAARRYLRSHPGPRDIALVVEVADATLFEDRTVKARLYARGRIPHYWIINLLDRQIEAYSRPRAGKQPHYQDQQVHGSKGPVPVVIEGRPIARLRVRDLLP